MVSPYSPLLYTVAIFYNMSEKKMFESWFKGILFIFFKGREEETHHRCNLFLVSKTAY